ncbi:putative multidrug resistance protein 1, 2 [Hibiscus syriacus]|uniref:Multidrug resistance protein 1, 2 n=1 Tax=Hibiscus syriacus TaxID=106335 RepID=A0A6A3B3Y5_HIBSY|nr:putative multidrug resistance protein 1, 2 [Hibiscus syriacus]
MYTGKVLLKSMYKEAIEAQQERIKVAAEAVSNHCTITSFCSQERILKMLRKFDEGPRRENVRQAWFAGYITAKAFTQTFLVMVRTSLLIAEAASLTPDLAKNTEVVRALFDIIDCCTQIEPDDSSGYLVEEITGHVEICDIDFAYPARPNVIFFEDFSITMEAGKLTALVGQSGSGKSTIINLIEGFYDPCKVVKKDGRDIRSYTLRSLRKHTALVSQEPTLFSSTIGENILYGALDKINESEVIEAAKAANAHDFIAGLADGYDNWCGGVQLSGDQKQRITIARAILKNPMML